MGFVSKAVSSVFGGDVEPAPVTQAPIIKDASKTTDDASSKEAKKKSAIVALNAAGGAATPALGAANVTRKTLLGL